MKIQISLSAKLTYTKVEELYDFRSTTDKHPQVTVTMPVKKDYTQAVTKLNGRQVVITFWAIPKPNYTVALYKDENDSRPEQTLKLTNVKDVSGNAAEYLYFGHI